MKKSRTLSFLSKRAAMLFVVASVSVGALAQTISFVDEGGKTRAVIDGNSEVDVNIPTPVEVNYIDFNRTFTPDVAATVIFPFEVKKESYVSGGTFYKFHCIEKKSRYCVDTGETEYYWAVVMKNVNKVVESTDEKEPYLDANKPYLFMPSESKITFDLKGESVEFVSVSGNDEYTANCDCECWQFIGVYEKKIWIEGWNSLTPEKQAEILENYEYENNGFYYGLAANKGMSEDSKHVHAGEFVRFSGDLTTQAFIKPMRAYLKYYCGGPTAKLGTRSAGNEQPDRLAVILLDVDGSVTSVGTISTETSEISFEGWFTLDGVKLPSEPTANGIYIHNGKKVAVSNK